MRTKPVAIAETATFLRQAEAIWSEEERMALVDFVARNPESGDIIPARAGCVKFGGAGRDRASAAGRG